MYDAIRGHPPRQRDLRRAADRAKAWSTRRGSTSSVKQFTTLLEGEFEAGAAYKPNKADWFAGRWSGLHAPADAETARRNVETGIDRKLFDSARPHADDRPRQRHDPQDARARARRQARDVQAGREFRLGDRRGAGVRVAAVGRLWRPPVGAGFGPRHVQPAPRGVGRPDRRAQIRAARRRSSMAGSRCSIQPAQRIWRARVRIWLCARRPEDAGAVGGAVRRLRQRRADHDRPVHRRGRGQVAARQRPGDAAAARLRRAGAGA